MQTGGQHVVDLPVRLCAQEVLRAMGCRDESKVREEVRGLTARVLQQARGMLKPRAVYAVRAVERMTDTELKMAGSAAIHGPIAGFLKPAKRVVTFVITVGDAVEKRASALMSDGDMLEGYAWHAIGSAAADDACDSLIQHLLGQEATPDEGITPMFSPGYCGLGIEQQQAIFSIVDAAAIGVKLHDSMIMEPIKSVSGLMGIGPLDQVDVYGVPCQYCELPTCSMRRDTPAQARIGQAT